MIGVQAQKSNLTPEKGWSQITELPSGLNNYFFSLYTHTDDYAMVYGEGSNGKQGTGKYTMKYTSGVDANSNYNALWKVEAHTASQGTVGNVAFRNVEGDSRTLQTEWGAAWFMHTNDQPDPCVWNQITPAYSISDAAWTLGNGQYPSAGSIGPWSALANGEDIAANKGSGDKTLFDIFAITRGRWVQNIASEATEEDPIEITRVLDNPGAERRVNGQGNLGGLGGWTVTGSGIDTQNNNAYSKKTGTWYFQSWVGSGHIADASMSQTINNLPNGKYKLTVDAAFGGTGCSVYANNTETAIGSTEQEYSVTTSITNGTLTVGMKAVSTNSTYLRFDNFKLFYLGVDLDGYKETLNNDRTTASGLLTSVMNADVKSALQDAYDDTEDVESTQSALEAAISLIEGAIDNANASIGIYTQIAAINTKAAALDASGVAAYASTKAAYDARTLTTVEEAQTAYIAAIKAQTTAGSDWTAVITNPSFEENTAAFAEPIGWTLSGTAAGIQTQNNSGFDGYKVGTMFGERWSNSTIGDFDAYQTIEGMPSGVYELKAVATFNGTGGYLYANDIKTNVTEAKYYTVQVALDANSTLTVGVKNETSGNGSWFKCDDFTLKLVSAGLPDVTPVVGKMNATVAAAQTAAVEAYEANKTVANYNAASAAIAAAQTSKDAYTTGKSALDKVDAILANTNVYTAEAYTTFSEAKLAAQNGYDNGTWTSEEAQAYGSTVFGTGWRSNATIDDFLISAWDAAPRDWSTYHINTWSTTGDSGNPNFVTPCFEYWGNDNTTLADKLMTATLGGFDPGATYKVTATVCVGVNTGVAASTDPTGVTLQLNDGSPVSACTGVRIAETRFYEGTFEANATVGVDGNLVIKLNVDGTNASWITWRDVKYTKTGDAPANWSANLKVADGKMGTFIAPFVITLPAGVKAYSATTTETEVKLTKIAEGGEELAAGTPVIVYGDDVSVDKTFYGVPTVTENQTVGALTGILDDSNKTISSGKYVLQTQSDVQAFYKLASNATGKLNRCFVSAEVAQARLVISIDEEDPTAINAIEAANAKAGALKDGKYLIGNKVVLVKNGVKYGANGQILK